ncbi:MAG TPA: metallophosphoesterase [Candidatus Sumerlaeota bacterium]|nr:metallophosphoesterase [Candidatus Sumerlaeota bacterium]
MKLLFSFAFGLGALLLAACAAGPRPVTSHIPAHDGPTPWTHLDFTNDPADFQFLVMGDRTGGHRAGIFPKAVKSANQMRPEFVICVGDLIEGYTEDEAVMDAMWDEFDAEVSQLEAPFFYVPGNHDVSNPAMERKWIERLGRPYYHFVYGNVLFLVLDSEDPPRAFEGEHPHLDQAQLAWIRETLAANRDVRWTFLFLHKPVWTVESDTNWNDVEAMLADRPYTVFCGHSHDYAKYERNGREYYNLATTGGGSRLRGHDVGEFDHITWVTMTDAGPRVAPIELDGILDNDIIHADFKAVVDGVRDRVRVICDPVVAETQAFTQIDSTVRMTNESPVAVDVDMVFRNPTELRLSRTAFTAHLHPGEQREWPVTFQSDQPVQVDEVGLIPYDYTVRFSVPGQEGERRIEASGTTGVLLSYPIPRTEVSKTIDGDLSDWTSLPLAKPDPSPVREALAPVPVPPADLSYRFGVEHDDHYLYIAVDVTDDYASTHEAEHKWWMDSTVVRIDARPRERRFRGGREYEDYLVIVQNPGDSEREAYRPDHLPAGARAVTQLTDAGRATEIAIPVAWLDERQGGPWRDVRIHVEVLDYDQDPKAQTIVPWLPDWRWGGNIPNSGTFIRQE